VRDQQSCANDRFLVAPIIRWRGHERAYEGGTGYGTGYHGYWVQNYDPVNAHFGDWQAVQELSRELPCPGDAIHRGYHAQ
jgi:hypothetical protein